jgi:hypothetical protein
VRDVSRRERRMTSQDDTGNHRVPRFTRAPFLPLMTYAQVMPGSEGLLEQQNNHWLLLIVLRLVRLQALRFAGAGIAMGTILGLGLAQVVGSLLYNIRRTTHVFFS